jgi:hypothetical protein
MEKADDSYGDVGVFYLPPRLCRGRGIVESYLDLPIRDKISDIVFAVVETPFASAIQFESVQASRDCWGRRNSHFPVHNPGGHDFIPKTPSEYGDPGDLLNLEYTRGQLRQDQRTPLQRFGTAQ